MTKQLAIAVSTAVLLGGCNGAFWGNFIVLGITVGIFLGTLSLGRARDAASRSASQSSSTTSRS
jgi:hypothetical protein